jgi:hypothetical protein
MPVFETITWIARTFREQRQSLRESVRYSAWIDLGPAAAPRHCTVLDVSEDGARLLLPSRAPLPSEFSLLFTRYGMIRRRCRLIWHSGVEVGVSYLGSLEYEDAASPRRGSFLRH